MTFTRLIEDAQHAANQAEAEDRRADSFTAKGIQVLIALLESAERLDDLDSFTAEDVFEPFGYNPERPDLKTLEEMVAAGEHLLRAAGAMRNLADAALGWTIGQGSAIRLGDMLYTWRLDRQANLKPGGTKRLMRILAGLDPDGDTPGLMLVNSETGEASPFTLDNFERMTNWRYMRRGEFREWLSETLPQEESADEVIDAIFVQWYDGDPKLARQPVDHTRAPKYAAKMDHGEIRPAASRICPDCQGTIRAALSRRSRGESSEPLPVCERCGGRGLVKIEKGETGNV